MVCVDHGSLAATQRSEIEELLKAGHIRALVATSSLELGIDMGAVDLVVQIEAPPSVASGMQRIGRAGHQVGAASEGIIFPKVSRRPGCVCSRNEGYARRACRVHALPSQPSLDVLAQQIVAIVAQPPARSLSIGKKNKSRVEPEIGVEELLQLIRCAAPFAALSRSAFEDVLDILAGKYPSDEFAELRPRITWNRNRKTLTPREGAKEACDSEWRHNSRPRFIWCIPCGC